MATELTNLYRGPEITLIRRPVLALSSVTDSEFATQTWVPSEATAAGELKSPLETCTPLRAADEATGRPGEEARRLAAKRAPPITTVRLAKRPARTRLACGSVLIPSLLSRAHPKCDS